MDPDLHPAESRVGAGSKLNIYDQKGNLLKYGFAVINADHRTATAEYRFTQPDVYTIKPYQVWNTEFGPFRVTVGNARP
jgi:hypothetical protein